MLAKEQSYRTLCDQDNKIENTNSINTNYNTHASNQPVNQKLIQLRPSQILQRTHRKNQSFQQLAQQCRDSQVQFCQNQQIDDIQNTNQRENSLDYQCTQEKNLPFLQFNELVNKHSSKRRALQRKILKIDQQVQLKSSIYNSQNQIILNTQNFHQYNTENQQLPQIKNNSGICSTQKSRESSVQRDLNKDSIHSRQSSRYINIMKSDRNSLNRPYIQKLNHVEKAPQSPVFKVKQRQVVGTEQLLISSIIDLQQKSHLINQIAQPLKYISKRGKSLNFRIQVQKVQQQSPISDQISQNNKEVIKIQSLAQAYQKQGLTEYNRAKMIDWMYQVFSVFNRSNDKTIFTAISIMDRYLIKTDRNFSEAKNLNDQYHLIGIASIFLSSKLEDKNQISLKSLLQDAGHKKFQSEQLLELEKDILKTLNFKIINQLPFEESMMSLKIFLHDIPEQIISNEDKKLIYEILTIVNYTNIYSQDISSEEIRLISLGQIILAFRILLLIKNKNQVSSLIWSQSQKQNSSLSRNIEVQTYQMQKLKDCVRSFRLKNKINYELMINIKRVNQMMITNILNFEVKFENITNIVGDNLLFMRIKEALKLIIK